MPPRVVLGQLLDPGRADDHRDRDTEAAGEAARAQGCGVGAPEPEDDAAHDAEGESSGDGTFAPVLVRQRPGEKEAGDQAEDVEGEEEVDLDGTVMIDLSIHQQQR